MEELQRRVQKLKNGEMKFPMHDCLREYIKDQEFIQSHKCAMCNKKAIQACNKCHLVFYCSNNHRKQDKKHPQLCK